MDENKEIQKEENEMGMMIPIVKNLFISCNIHEFHLCEIIKNKAGEDVKSVLQYCHYSTLESLLKKFPDFYLKKFSVAKSITELKNDLNEIKKILENVNLKLSV